MGQKQSIVNNGTFSINSYITGTGKIAQNMGSHFEFGSCRESVKMVFRHRNK